MPIPFRCPDCDHTATMADALAGKKTRCPECGAVSRVGEPPDDSVHAGEAEYSGGRNRRRMEEDSAEDSPPRRRRAAAGDGGGEPDDGALACPRCGRPVSRSRNPLVVMATGVVGHLLVQAFGSLQCPRCGPIAQEEFSRAERGRIGQGSLWRIIGAGGASVSIILVLVLITLAMRGTASAPDTATPRAPRDVAGGRDAGAGQDGRDAAGRDFVDKKNPGADRGPVKKPPFEPKFPAGLDALRLTRFLEPPVVPQPTSYLQLVSTDGDPIGRGKSYSFDAGLKAGKTGEAIYIHLDAWHGLFVAPRGQMLAVGEYHNVKRYPPLQGQSPGMSVFGEGRVCSKLSGQFVVWEIEMRGDEVVRLAIDFIQYCEETQPPLYGMIRFNSTRR